jgi:hypothetical protein
LIYISLDSTRSREGVVRSLDDDSLRLKIVLESLFSELSAKTRVLIASEGSVGIKDIIAVDVDSSSS